MDGSLQMAGYISVATALHLLLKSKQHMHSGKLVMDWMCYLPISTTAHYQCAQVTALAVKQ